MNTTAIMQIIVSNTSISKTQYDKIKKEIDSIPNNTNKKDLAIENMVDILERIVKYSSHCENELGVKLENTLPYQDAVRAIHMHGKNH